MTSNMLRQEPMQPEEGQGPSIKTRRASLNVFGQLSKVFLVAALMATLFTAWTPLGLLPQGISDWLAEFVTRDNGAQAANFPTPTPRPRPRIGIVAGHWGGDDSGAVCSDGLTEVSINLDVATRVKEMLTQAGFDVDLLQEFDDKLTGYNGLVLVSIHADTCEFIDDNATGFKVAPSMANATPEKATRLVACISDRYAKITGLRFHPGSVTTHMTSYHAFNEINSSTTAAIIETGFMNLDRQILTQQPDLIAQGIAQGILCYVYNQNASGD